MQYFKNNPAVEAIQWTNTPDNFSSLIEFTNSKVRSASPLIWEQSGYTPKFDDIELQTPDGAVIVPKNFWIIKHAENVFYPCSDSCFKRLYSIM